MNTKTRNIFNPSVSEAYALMTQHNDAAAKAKLIDKFPMLAMTLRENPELIIELALDISARKMEAQIRRKLSESVKQARH